MLSSETFLSSQFWHVFQWKSKKVIVAKSARINVLNNSVEVITIFFLYEPILHGRQLGDYFPNQVASSKILGAMATKMVATWRVDYYNSAFSLWSQRSGLTPEGLIPIVFWGAGEERWSGERKNLSYPKQGKGVCICTGSIVLLSNMSTFAFTSANVWIFSKGLYLHGEMRDKQLPMQKNLLGVFWGLWM